jgi:CTP synthase (UTP-ammonia lyase)
VLVEHARNVMGIRDAVHAEYGLAGTPVVTLLSCSLAESQIDIKITPNSHLAEIYGELLVTEQTNCNYGLEPSFAHIAFSGGLTVSAVDNTDEVRAIERADHPFFVATLYQPQRTSRPDTPHPVWTAFVRAATS